MIVNLIPFPQPLPVLLPTVEGNVDYTQLRHQLQRMDQLLHDSGLETRFLELSLQDWERRAGPKAAPLKPKAQQRFQEHSRRALRCNLARTLMQENFRGFAVRLADSPLLQWFCGVSQVDRVKVPSKSTLERYDKWLPEPTLRPLMEELLRAGRDQAPQLQLEEPLDLDVYFLDTTCLKANIHFPVDWVLLRDGTRTLMRAVRLIRGQGLKHRMEAPEQFLKRMNQLAIQMTHARRKPDSKKQRKQVLRQMKRLSKIVEGHARRYRDLLDREWEQTEWTRPQADQVLRRWDGVLEQWPAAIAQAHERIIGERPVKNAEKILSLYDSDVQVIVRGKAEAEVEFGNLLLLGESADGLIVDWELFQDQVPADVKLLRQSVERTEQGLGQKLKGVGADRGFDSAANRRWLGRKKIYNGICPRAPENLKRRCQQQRFVAAQTRRAQTEGRIGIFKNNFLGRPLRAKGFVNRQRAVAWGVLTHNLWVMARLPQLEAAPAKRQAA
jgi:hypothetical protein